MPNIRRFLLDNNVRWPNLINGTGTNDYAKAYGVAEIPSNVLIGRDGTVIHLDLSPRKNLATVVAKAVASLIGAMQRSRPTIDTMSVELHEAGVDAGPRERASSD